MDPVDLVSGIPAGEDHNAGRIKFGPDGMLYYSNGEQGHNQFASVCKPIESQLLPTSAEVKDKDWSAYRGKVLRIAADGSIPKDNPKIDGVRSHVFTVGHRNPQGLVFGSNGDLYSSEQGPSSDDEINLLAAGKNYGWPHVNGYQDNQSHIYINWSVAPKCDPETAGGMKPKLDLSPNYVPVICRVSASYLPVWAVDATAMGAAQRQTVSRSPLACAQRCSWEAFSSGWSVNSMVLNLPSAPVSQASLRQLRAHAPWRH